MLCCRHAEACLSGRRDPRRCRTQLPEPASRQCEPRSCLASLQPSTEGCVMGYPQGGSSPLGRRRLMSTASMRNSFFLCIGSCLAVGLCGRCQQGQRRLFQVLSAQYHYSRRFLALPTTYRQSLTTSSVSLLKRTKRPEARNTPPEFIT